MKILTILIFASLMTSCTQRPVAPTLKSEDGIAVASVDGSIISDKDLLDRISAIEKAYPRSYSTFNQKKSLLKEMMHTELLYREALKLGLDKKYEFKSRLADLYLREMSEQARASISEKQIQKFFEENRASVEQISVRHILLKSNPGAPSSERAKVKAKLEGLRSELLKNPSEFANYARKYSEDSSANNGGELGFFQRPRMVREFSDAAFKLKKIDDISPVTETQFGFHLIQLTGDKRGFEPYKALIQDRFLRQTQKERLDAEIERLSKGKKLQIFEDQLTKISPLPKEILTDPKELIPEGKLHGDHKK